MWCQTIPPLVSLQFCPPFQSANDRRCALPTCMGRTAHPYHNSYKRKFAKSSGGGKRVNQSSSGQPSAGVSQTTLSFKPNKFGMKFFSSNEVHGNGGGGKVIGGGGGKGSKAAKLLARVPLTQQPRAPNNTTQFLITDREERESSDRDTSTDALGTSAEFSKMRPRCYSSACTTKNDTSIESSFLMQSSDSDEEQEEEDTEFDTIYDNVSLERIQGLPRDKVNREMLATQKCNSHLVDKVTHLKTENHRLKSLLQQHGIDFNKSASPELNSSLFSPQHMLLKQSTSRSSVESEENSRAGNGEEAKRIERSPVTVKQEQR